MGTEEYQPKDQLVKVFHIFMTDYTPTRNEYNYDQLGKNHIPNSQKDFGNMDYKNDNYNKNYPSYGNKNTGHQKYRE